MAFFQKRNLFVKLNDYDPVYDDEDEEDEDYYDDWYIDTTIYGGHNLGKLQISCFKQTL